MIDWGPYWLFVAVGVALLALFFWGRGLIRANRGDMIAGFLILVATCYFVFAACPCAGLNAAGVFVIAFGAATLVLSRFAHPKCGLSKSERDGLGVVAICVGLLMQLFL